MQNLQGFSTTYFGYPIKVTLFGSIDRYLYMEVPDDFPVEDRRESKGKANKKG